MATERIHGYCPLCNSRCGCVSLVEDGRLVGVEPDPEHPTGQVLCVKAQAAPELVDSDARLLHPLRRASPKGGDASPGWRPVSWEESLDAIAGRLRAIAAQYGPESVAFAVATPSGTAIADAFGWIHRLAHAFGTPNVMFATENCNWHKDHAAAHTFGAGIGTPDFEQSGCILLWGFNPTVTWPVYAQAVVRAKRRGAALIVVDPRRAGLAAQADEWLPVRPGGDGPLALGLAGAMIGHGWFDEAFIRDWTNGPFLVREDGRLLTGADLLANGSADERLVWDASGARPVRYDPKTRRYESEAVRPALGGRYRIETVEGAVVCRPAFERFAELCRAYPPERVEAETGVPAAQIVKTARLLFERRPVAYFHWTGICHHADATQTGRAIGLLYALTGSYDAPGGNVHFARPPLNDIFGWDLLAPEQKAKTLGLGERPAGPPAKGWITSKDLVRAVLSGDPYPVRALVAFGANFLLTKPHTQGLSEALAGLDLYVHADLFETPTSRHADFLLPVASAWERPGLAAGFQIGAEGEARLQWRPAVVAPRGEARSDTWIVFELARRLGLGDRFFDGDMERAVEHLLAPSGTTLEALRAAPRGVAAAGATVYRKYEKRGFATPSGRLEIYSERLLAAGADPLPSLKPPAPTVPAPFPLLLTCAKWPHFCHSQHRGLPMLRRRNPEPLVQVHPETGAARGIADGQWVVVRTALGQFRARARFERGLRKDTVCAQYGWWEGCPSLGLPGFVVGGAGNGSYNAVISAEEYDPISGSNGLRGVACDLRPEGSAP